ncbi:ATP-binding protein [Lentzea rhizosphaerae]|uniref:ATP-binding protein n=1 Tax=Lentzea rhizosphaerae TaxID=2041025 RepID=A0ABV8BIG6_9PSEU
MIGREEELRVLTGVVETGGAAIVLGEPGIGKSRLVTAAADHGVTRGMRVLRGRADPSAPLRALSEAVLSLARDDGLPADPVLLPYRHALARFAPEWRDSGTTDEPLVVVAEGLLRLLGVLGRDTGCVLVLEDLHDADVGTAAILDYLADNLAEQRVALLATARDEECPVLELARDGRRFGLAVVELARLDRARTGELVASCLSVASSAVPRAAAERVFRDSEGVPFVAGELLAAGHLVQELGGWSVRDGADTVVPEAVVHSVAGRVRRLGPELTDLLTTAAVFGRRFPLPVLRIMSGLGRHELVRRLRPAVTKQLVAPDHLAAGWYSFRHALTPRALLEKAGGERAELARRAAEAVEACWPGLPGEWCAVAAGLWLVAGETGTARRLFVDAGQRALTDGNAAAAVGLLRRAQELATACCEPIAVLTPLLTALAEAGEVEQAFALAANVDDLGLDQAGRAVLHTTLAQVAVRAGLPSRGHEELETARRLLGPGASPELTVRIDLITAGLGHPDAEDLALRALAQAARSRLPVLACEALELLGTLAVQRDPAESDARLRRMAELAHRHGLPAMRLRSRARSAVNHSLRSGDDTRLRQVCGQAFEAGAVLEGHLLQAKLVMTTVLRGEFVLAAELADRCLPEVTRLGLRQVADDVITAKAVAFALRGQRSAMERAVRSLDGTTSALAACETFCALAEEDRRRAVEALDVADARDAAHHLQAWPHGLRVLLGALDGEMGWSHHGDAVEAARAGSAWHRQFLLLTEAVLAGRDGRAEQAAEAMAEHGRVAEPFALTRRLGLRLAAEAALTDGWGDPASWLREAEEYFHVGQLTALRNACRTLLRGAGWTASQRRTGTSDVPARLRLLGITARENEVLRLLAERLGNTEIARRLYISPRTAEKHVASLLAKTGEHDRRSLHRFAIDHLSDLAG